MTVASKKAVRNIALSLAFLLALTAVAITARPFAGVAIASAAILGLPFILLSIADLGRALKLEHGGNYRATIATNLLSHYRAAGGAICIAAAGYMLFQNVRALLNGTSSAPMALQSFWVALGVLMVVVGVLLIFRAFAKETASDE